MRLLLVTNDFPPRVGGIQSYLWNIYERLARDGHDVRVLAPAHPGDVAFDTAPPMEIVRWPGRVYWPARSLERRVRDLARDRDAVAFGAVLPMNLIATRLDVPVVVHTHGAEVGFARTPLAPGLRRIGRAARLVTVVADYTRRFIQRAIGEGPAIELLRTGVDLERFRPGVDGSEVRKRHGLGSRPLAVCVSRLVPRKGQDLLIEALPLLRREVPDAALLLVGGGPLRERLAKLARERAAAGSVAFAGEVGQEDLPAHYAAGDAFAMPCRSRWGGLEVEGLGLVYLEAQACGRPAITGDSGGAPEAVIPGRTGFVVGGRDRRGLAAALAGLLGDPERARRMGEAGRRFVEERHAWDTVVARFGAMLDRAVR